MDVPAQSREPMDVEAFFAFTDTRPDHEKWELIDGEPVRQMTPTMAHQIILGSLNYCFYSIRRERHAPWLAIPGIGVRISATSLVQPDFLIFPNPHDGSTRECDDAIVTVEVLSEETADRDLRWKRKAYPRVASLMHYVVIAQDAVEVVVYSRASNFTEQRLESLAATLDLPVLGISLPLAEIYRDIDLS